MKFEFIKKINLIIFVNVFINFALFSFDFKFNKTHVALNNKSSK